MCCVRRVAGLIFLGARCQLFQGPVKLLGIGGVSQHFSCVGSPEVFMELPSRNWLGQPHLGRQL